MKKELKRLVDKLSEHEIGELDEYLAEERENSCAELVKADFGSKELKKEFSRLDSVWSSESRIRTFATIQILEKLEKLLKTKRKR